MASTVTLVYTSTTVTLPAPTYPEEPGNTLQQSIMQSMSGRVMSVTRIAGTLTNTVLHFRLNETDYNLLDSFIRTTVTGASLAFTYTDHESVAHTAARYLGGLPGTQADLNDWVVDLRLNLA